MHILKIRHAYDPCSVQSYVYEYAATAIGHLPQQEHPTNPMHHASVTEPNPTPAPHCATKRHRSTACISTSPSASTNATTATSTALWIKITLARLNHPHHQTIGRRSSLDRLIQEIQLRGTNKPRYNRAPSLPAGAPRHCCAFELWERIA